MILLGKSPSLLIVIYAALSVLIIGYPCALGMAMPLALIRGQVSVLKKVSSCEVVRHFRLLKDVKKIVFDKTGTITAGKPEVTEVYTLPNIPREELIRLAASVEKNSEHPIAKAIIKKAKELSLYQVKSFRARPGLGVEAVIEGRKILIGNRRFMDESDVDVKALEDVIKSMENKGITPVIVAREGRSLEVLGISDRIKSEAKETIEILRKKGLSPLMITGDNEKTAKAVASKVGIDEVLAGVLPDEKAERIRVMQKSGERVAMIGDGINDAPALMQADIGIAIGTGTDIAIESADIILIQQDLSNVLSAFDLSIKTYRKIRQNLIWAFMFNGIGIPVAATGWLHPLMAMAAMILSTTAIMINSFGFKITTSIRQRAGEKKGEYAVMVLNIPGIHCKSCIDRIEKSLLSIKGVKSVSGDPETKKVRIFYDQKVTGRDTIRETVVGLGYFLGYSEGYEKE